MLSFDILAAVLLGSYCINWCIVADVLKNHMPSFSGSHPRTLLS